MEHRIITFDTGTALGVEAYCGGSPGGRMEPGCGASAYGRDADEAIDELHRGAVTRQPTADDLALEEDWG